MKKTLIMYPSVFLGTVLVCLLFLLVTTLVPQDAIYGNAKKSAEYFYSSVLFENKFGNLENFKIDNYADCITAGIAWHFGEGENAEAVISAKYNRVDKENVNDSFYRMMSGEDVTTESYSRYWHGSAGIVRILLLFTDIQSIRYVIAAVGVVLNLLLVMHLFRRKQAVLGILYSIAFLGINGGFALTCLEYAFVFLLIPVITLLLLKNDIIKSTNRIQLLFMVTGMLTAFFDFLTAETLTFTMPFVLLTIVRRNSNPVEMKRDKSVVKQEFFLFLKTGVCWLTGYAGMFLSKWLLAAIFLGGNAFSGAVDSALNRVDGEINGLTTEAGTFKRFWEILSGIVFRNTGCLYWGRSDMQVSTIIYITVAILLVLFVIWYLFRKKKTEYNWLLVVVAVIPYIRFLILGNHSYLHYFFTYRAQMVTVFVILYMIYQSTWLSETKREENTVCRTK